MSLIKFISILVWHPAVVPINRSFAKYPKKQMQSPGSMSWSNRLCLPDSDCQGYHFRTTLDYLRDVWINFNVGKLTRLVTIALSALIYEIRLENVIVGVSVWVLVPLEKEERSGLPEPINGLPRFTHSMFDCASPPLGTPMYAMAHFYSRSPKWTLFYIRVII